MSPSDDNIPPRLFATSRRDAARRGAVRSGGVEREFSLPLFHSSVLRAPSGSHPLSFIPDAFEFTSSAPRGLSFSPSLFFFCLGVLMYHRARIRIIPRNRVDQCFATDSEECERKLAKGIVSSRIGFPLSRRIIDCRGSFETESLLCLVIRYYILSHRENKSRRG